MVLKHKNNSINKIGSRKFTSPCEHYLPNSEAEAEAVNNNREIAREYGISESMARKWRNQQDVLFSGFDTLIGILLRQ